MELIKHQMEKKNVNMLGMRRVLNIAYSSSKMEKRSLYRIKHIQRMNRSRTIEQVPLG